MSTLDSKFQEKTAFSKPAYLITKAQFMYRKLIGTLGAAESLQLTAKIYEVDTDSIKKADGLFFLLDADARYHEDTQRAEIQSLKERELELATNLQVARKQIVEEQTKNEEIIHNGQEFIKANFTAMNLFVGQMQAQAQRSAEQINMDLDSELEPQPKVAAEDKEVANKGDMEREEQLQEQAGQQEKGNKAAGAVSAAAAARAPPKLSATKGTGELFSCSLCHKAFNLKGNLKKHEEIHNGVKFFCPEMHNNPKSFYSKRSSVNNKCVDCREGTHQIQKIFVK